MNLYLRLLWTVLRSRRLPRLQPGQTLRRSLCVLPNDIDVNGHMKTGRYLTVIDLMLVEYFVRIGFAAVMLEEGLAPDGRRLLHHLPPRPETAAALHAALPPRCCDERWNYMRFEFLDGEQVCAAGYMKGAALARSGLVANSESYAALGQPVFAPELPQPVRHWLDA